MPQTTSPAHSVCDPDVPEQHSSPLPQGSPDSNLDDREDRWVEIKDPNGYPSLDFKPMVLRSFFLIGFLLFFLACFSCLFVLLYRSEKHGSIHLSSKPSYFALHYSPTVVGTITSILWQTIATNFFRLAPYMSMAGSSRNQTWEKTMGAAYFPYLIFNFRGIHWILLAVHVTQITMISILPLKSALFISTGEPIQGRWEIQFSPYAAEALLLIYALLVCSTFALVINLWGRRTGLKWDSVTIADKLVLFHGSDILDDFDGLDTMGRERTWYLFWKLWVGGLGWRTYRLGYWSKGGEIWHGIRKGSNYSGGKITKEDNTNRPVPSAKSDMFSKTWVIIFTIYAYLTAVGLILGFIKGKPITGGSLTIPIPQLSQSVGIFIFRGFLTNGAGMFVRFWFDADLFYRASQPFVGMYEGNPRPASENILLDYLCSPPIIVSIEAVMNSHLKVAYFSCLSLVSRLFPVLVGGLFVVEPSTDGIVLLASVRSYCAICVFILVYCISIPLTLPTRKRMLPRSILSLGDLVSFCYDSKLLTSPEFESAFTLNLPTDTKKHMECRLFLMEKKYEFFTYRTDSGWRFGFDVARDRV